jgi:hypothetical protein
MNVHLSKEAGSSRWSVLFFILATLGFWWLFAVLSHSVVRCIPGGDACWYPWQDATGLKELPEKMGIAVLIISLLAALWAAQRLVFPPEDFSKPDKKSLVQKIRDRFSGEAA